MQEGDRAESGGDPGDGVLEISDGSGSESSCTEFLIDQRPRRDLAGIFSGLEGLRKVRVCGSVLYLADLERLRPRGWLNDRIINAYFELLRTTFKNSYVLSTYAFSSMQGKPFSTVKEWFRGADLTAFEYVLVPVHCGAHWTLVVVSEYDVECYDSLGGECRSAGRAISGLMCALRHDKHQSGGRYRVFDMARYIPLQANGDDCGVFCCMFARFRVDPRVSGFFPAKAVPTMRRRMLHELLAESIIYRYK